MRHTNDIMIKDEQMEKARVEAQRLGAQLLAAGHRQSALQEELSVMTSKTLDQIERVGSMQDANKSHDQMSVATTNPSEATDMISELRRTMEAFRDTFKGMKGQMPFPTLREDLDQQRRAAIVYSTNEGGEARPHAEQPVQGRVVEQLDETARASQGDSMARSDPRVQSPSANPEGETRTPTTVPMSASRARSAPTQPFGDLRPMPNRSEPATTIPASCYQQEYRAPDFGYVPERRELITEFQRTPNEEERTDVRRASRGKG